MVRTLLWIGDTAPEFPEPPPDHIISEGARDTKLWWNTTTGILYQYNSTTEEYDIEVNFVNSSGLTGTKVIDGKSLTFTNGILTGYEVI